MNYTEFEKICENWNGKVCLYGCGLIGKTWGLEIIEAAGLKPDYYCDKKYEDEEIVHNIPVISIDDLITIRDNVLVFLTLKEKYQKEVCELLNKNGITNIVLMGDTFYQDFIYSIQESKRKDLYKKYECIMDDRKYLESRFEMIMGYKLDLDNPQTFNEKLQWLKINDRKSIYTQMVDKYEVKKYVGDAIGYEYIVPALGVWNSFDEIDFSMLPDKFVLKCTHDSGGVVICRDKKKFDFDFARKKISSCLKTNFYLMWREWPYKDVFPRIIAEEYLEKNDQIVPEDYKIFCFNGKAKWIKLYSGRNTDNKTQDFYDKDWNYTEISQNDAPRSGVMILKPPFIDEMIRLSEYLSSGISQVRCDWYYVNNKIKFGEFTFFDGGGFVPFGKYDDDIRFGNDIVISDINREV